MANETKVIGIPGWAWKFRLLEHAKSNKNIQNWITSSLCYECSRHFELLQYFDQGKKEFTKTEYYMYQIKNKKNSKGIMGKIEKFRQLYQNMKDGIRVACPVVTDDGCRLDGSHRCAIFVHLKKKISLVNVVAYESVYTKVQSKEIRKLTKEYRASVYGL